MYNGTEFHKKTLVDLEIFMPNCILEDLNLILSFLTAIFAAYKDTIIIIIL